MLSGWEKIVTWPSWLRCDNLASVDWDVMLRRGGREIHLRVNESACWSDECCKPGTLG